MKAQIEEYKGWDIWAEWEEAERFVESVRWTAHKFGDSVEIAANKVEDVRNLIDLREAAKDKRAKEYITMKHLNEGGTEE
jgi:hypothetical protein